MIATRRPRHQLLAARLRPVRAASFLALALVAGQARADDWPTPGLDATHTRLLAERSGAAFADGLWSAAPASTAGVLASPVASDGYLVSATYDGTVRALAADTGALVWQVSLGAAIEGTPAIASGRVFVPTLAGKIVALGLADGATLWSTDLGGLTVSSPAVVGSDLIVGAGMPQQFIARIDGTTGVVVWRTLPVMQEFSNTPPAVADGLVVVGTNGGHYYAFDTSMGLLRWDYSADGIVNIASPLIVGGTVYLAGGDSSDRVHAVNAATGAAIAGWPIDLPTPDPDLTGTLVNRRRAVSSFASAGGLLVLETRLDDAIDTDADGMADQYLSRELVLGLDPATGATVWQQPVARTVFGTRGDVPPFSVSPTPAAFGTDAGSSLLAIASSLSPTVSILDAQTGAGQGYLTTAGPALASPVLVNGRLITVTQNGIVEGRLSSVNHPPSAPILAGNPQTLDLTDVTLRWLPAVDPDGEVPTYEMRIDSDGEVLQTFAQQIVPAQGTTSIGLAGQQLQDGTTYTVALRARDGHGAYSPWSALETFTVIAPPPVTVNGMPVANLRAAVEGAQAGDVILLGAGTYPLASTLHVAGGVTIKGAGASRTILDGGGLSVAVSFSGTDPKSSTGLDRATVTNAATCVSIEGTAAGVELTHLVVRDCTTAGVAVAAGGVAAVMNATLVADGVGLNVAGSATIKNSLVSGNQTGLGVTGSGTLTGSYDDLFGNQVDRQGVVVGTGDLAAAVVYANPTSHDYRLIGPQPSTDQGDPVDPVGDEPTPNGARINLGAFGGTTDAELSTPAPVTPDPTPPPVPTGSGNHGLPGVAEGGCGVTGRPPPATALTLLAVASILIRRRRRG